MVLGETELLQKWSELNKEKEQLDLPTPIWQNNVVCKDRGKALLVNLSAAKIQLLLVTLWLYDSPGPGQHAKHHMRFFWVWTGTQLPNKHMLKLSCNKQALARRKVCEMHYFSSFSNVGTILREFSTCWPCVTKLFYVLQRTDGWKNNLYQVKLPPVITSWR